MWTRSLTYTTTRLSNPHYPSALAAQGLASVLADASRDTLDAAMSLMGPEELSHLEDEARVIQNNVRAWLLRRRWVTCRVSQRTSSLAFLLLLLLLVTPMTVDEHLIIMPCSSPCHCFTHRYKALREAIRSLQSVWRERRLQQTHGGSGKGPMSAMPSAMAASPMALPDGTSG